MAGDKATQKITHVAQSMAESEGWKAGKGDRSGRAGSLICFLMLLNLALDLRGKERAWEVD